MDRAELVAFLEERLPALGARKAFLLGSWARGTATRSSDVDLVVVMQTDRRYLERYEDFETLESGLGLELDLFVYTPKEWEDIRERPFFRDIAIEGAELDVG